MKVIKEGRLPIKMWLEDIEEGALQQAKNLANLPFAYRHIAIMPDAHQGYGMPIGGVMATKGVVVPNAVGVDIGCGMCAVKTNSKAPEIATDDIKKILSTIRQVIPVGFNKHKEVQEANLMPGFREYGFYEDWLKDKKICLQEFNNARKSLGTLGGGNHFIELQKDEQNYLWIMLHSGSRNLGKKVADCYNKIAVELNEKYYSQVPKNHELAFLPLKTEEAQAYLKEMQFCVDFAFANRKLMMDRIMEILFDKLDCKFETPYMKYPNAMLNIAHNYATMENHFGQNVLVHRKGATRAREGEIGIIPGSQGTSSYIVKGLGNRESFMSCSHGAGRKMGRKQAQRELDLKKEIAVLDGKGILHSIRGNKDLDEAPSAYKNIDIVMENQTDLVEIVTKLIPLAVIKG